MSSIPQYTAATVTTTDGGVNNTSPLHFDLNTDPDPVRISPSSNDMRTADFVLVGSRRSASAIECRKITLTVPAGSTSPDLTPDLNSATAQISLPGWTPVTNTATKTITFTPASGHAEIGRDQGVTVQLMGMRINTVVGSAPLRIDLEWREAGSGDVWDTGTVVFDIGKFPADFHLANFMAEPLIIDNNGAVKLNWEASGASSLRLLYDAADINVLNLDTYPVNNVTHTTVFYLRATVQVGTNTVERILSTTVTVRTPDLEVANLRVLGEIIMPSPPPVLSVKPELGVDDGHPLENILDDDLETYFQSKGRALKLYWVRLDYDTVRPIYSIDIYFGDLAGRYLPPALRVYTWTGEPPWVYHNGSSQGNREWHFSSPGGILARSVQLIFQADSTSPVAIRSFQVSLFAPLRMTRDGAYFDVPVHPRQGIIEG
ncbi:hypothetical protein ABIA39_005367 [Nocardia sp. GAS34]|uniref:hypothetical protein n=1 Tax=unclassified Nocardia TaxID=2637762 RepID=UPI003D1DCAE8